MQLFVTGFNGLTQWPKEDDVIKGFHIVNLESFLNLNEKVNCMEYSINWCHNSFLINGKVFISGLVDKENKHYFQSLDHPDEKTFTNIVSCDDRYLLLYNKSDLTIWKYNLYNDKQSWQKLPDFISAETVSKADDDISNLPKKDSPHIAKIVCSATMNICLLSDGRLFNIPNEIPTDDLDGKTIDVRCGNEHGVLLTDKGKVYTWGGGSRCQLGHGDLESREHPTLVDALAGIDIVKIAAGGWHTCAISTFGDLYTWGWNDCGQLGIQTKQNEIKTTDKSENMNDQNSDLYDSVFSDNEFFDPSAFQASCSVKRPRSQENVSRKKSKSCSNVNENCNSYAIPHLIDIYDKSNNRVLEYNVVNVDCGSKHTIIVLDDGAVLGTGCNIYSQLGLDSNSKKTVKIFEPLYIRTQIGHLKCGDWTTTFLLKQNIDCDCHHSAAD